MKKIVWKQVWARKYAPYIASAYIKVFQTKPGFDMCRNKLFVPEVNLNAYYVAEHEFNDLIKNATELLMKQDMKKFAEEYEKRFMRFLSWAKRFVRTPFNRLSNQEIIKKFEECNRMLEESGENQFLSFVVLEGPGKELESMLSSFNNKEEIMQWIATPYKDTKITKIRLELLKMMKEGRISDKELKGYLSRYRWITMYDFVDKPLAMEDIKGMMTSISNPAEEINKIEDIKRDNLKRYKEFINSIKDKRLKKIAEIVHYFTYLKEMRDDYRRHAYYLLVPFLMELAKRAGITMIEANHLLSEELIDMIRMHNIEYKKKIEARQKKYSLLLKDGKLSIFDRDISSEYIKGLVSNDYADIKGVVANRGRVTGIVNIIFHRNEFSKFRQGDILVTAMTHPEFVPIIKKAKAIITDEGGITCHAAITAREFGIPCIIGTKNATKVLKDGDRVEVDADKGVVRKI